MAERPISPLQNARALFSRASLSATQALVRRCYTQLTRPSWLEAQKSTSLGRAFGREHPISILQSARALFSRASLSAIQALVRRCCARLTRPSWLEAQKSTSWGERRAGASFLQRAPNFSLAKCTRPFFLEPPSQHPKLWLDAATPS